MTSFPPFTQAADVRLREDRLCYSICTLVTKVDDYQKMTASFQQGGFTSADCEYLFLDNRGANSFDAFQGYNIFLSAARGDYIILCHQDIELLENGRADLDALLESLTQHDRNWGLCGNAGGIRPGALALRISDPHGANVAQGGPFPAKVTSLDENFIVVRRDANLALSNNLSGFHLYGTDLCIISYILGYHAYVIDFHLLHKSPGKTDHTFFKLKYELIDKYYWALRPRWITTTCTLCFISGHFLLNIIMNSSIGRKIIKRIGKRTPR